MNPLASLIEAQIASHESAAASTYTRIEDLKSQLADLEAQLVWHTAEAARHRETLAPAKKTVVWVNTNDGAELHAPKCGHLNKFRRDPLTEISSPEEWSSPQEFFNDYNSDFYAEGGDEACWNVTAFACTGWDKATITSYK